MSMTEQRQRAATRYLERGFSVIPVPSGQKNPGRTGWQDLRLTADDVPRFWTNSQNVGVLTGEPSGGRVDVDLDADEAVTIAGRFLIPTLTSGRESRPHSHWWYITENGRSQDWKAPDGEKLVELRADGRQTLVAPSTHPGGDKYAWHGESGLDMVEIEAEELTTRCRELATATLIARNVPPTGGRHDFAMALSGFLLRGRLDEETALKIMLAAWHAVEADSREALRDLEGIVRDTAKNIAVGEPVTGGTTLEESAPGVVGRLCKWWGWEKHRDAGDGEAGGGNERRNQADRLIGYALEELEDDALFTDQHGAPHALVDGDPVPLTSRCYSWLRRLMWEREQKAVNGEYLKTAAGTLAAHAEFAGDVRELHTRAAWFGGALYYELRPGRVVQVDETGWIFAPKPSVLFRRFANLKPLPDPETNENPADALNILGELVNLKTDRDGRLYAAYLITAALPHVGRPILNASGAMGSGKTTLSRVVKRTWDPTAPETIRFDPRDFLQKAGHAYILMLDNQNTVPEWAADTLCRLVTGEADSKRRLYTDDEDVIIELRRAVLLNGINIPTDRGDVLDRSLVVELERIHDAARRTEEELWKLFDAEHPRLLGAMLDVLAAAIARKSSIKLPRKPRLADWGEYAAAVYDVLGWGAETFLSDWDQVVRVQNQATLDGSPVAQAIIEFMKNRDEYAGTSSELHEKLEDIADDLGISVSRDKAWPKSARWLWRRIKEVLPLLAAADIEADRGRDKQAKQISLRKTSESNGTDGTTGEKPVDKPNLGADTARDDGIANGTDDGTISADEKPVGKPNAGGASNADSAIISGGKSKPPLSSELEPGQSATLEELQQRRSGFPAGDAVRKLLEDPPNWLRNQIAHARGLELPKNQMQALAASVASQTHGTSTRGAEVLPVLEEYIGRKNEDGTKREDTTND